MHLTARLLYRKVDQYLLNFIFGEKAGLTMTVTEMARAEGEIVVRPAIRSGARRTRAAALDGPSSAPRP
jgi:hypothetical protein